MDQFNFNNFPETNFNEVNLSWMLEVMTQFKEDIESGQFVGPQGPQGPQGDPGPAGDGITEDVKQALLQLARKVAYIDDQGQTYYQDLYDALYGTTPAELVSISAAYTQTGTVYDTDSLDSLKADLIVTAAYSDSSTAVIPAANYTLTGSLTVGTSTITVSYQGETATFQVTVTASEITLISISAAFNQGSAVIYESDSLDTLKQYLTVTAAYSDSSTAVIPSTDYTLSGTLTEGTSTITVTYQGQTTTFTVTVTAADNVLYSLENHTFNNSNPIATGVYPLTTDKDITFAFDVDFAGQQSGTIWKLFACINGSGAYAGLALQAYSVSTTSLQIQNMTDKLVVSTDFRNYVGNFKYIVTHVAGSGQWHIYYKKGSDGVVDEVRTSAFVPVTGQITIGGTASATQVFNGTVNSATVYSKVLSASEITAFMG